MKILTTYKQPIPIRISKYNAVGISNFPTHNIRKLHYHSKLVTLMFFRQPTGVRLFPALVSWMAQEFT
jgi:hypothetical protein